MIGPIQYFKNVYKGDLDTHSGWFLLFLVAFLIAVMISSSYNWIRSQFK
jgi:hypothetical protein